MLSILDSLLCLQLELWTEFYEHDTSNKTPYAIIGPPPSNILLTKNFTLIFNTIDVMQIIRSPNTTRLSILCEHSLTLLAKDPKTSGLG